jgi:hypothetical protein
MAIMVDLTNLFFGKSWFCQNGGAPSLAPHFPHNNSIFFENLETDNAKVPNTQIVQLIVKHFTLVLKMINYYWNYFNKLTIRSCKDSGR